MIFPGTVKSSERLKRSLQKASRLTSVPIEVFIASSTTHVRLRKRLASLLSGGAIANGQAIIGVDPVNRHVALGLRPEVAEALPPNERVAWLKGLQEDLHMTAFENALAMGVLSLAMALSERFPATNADERTSTPGAPHHR